MSRLHCLVSTHTTRHLRRSILGVALQRRTPDVIVISCDNDRDDVRSLVRDCSSEFADLLPQGLRFVRRASLGVGALAQVRNNAVRALLDQDAGARDGDLLLFVDGDCCPAHDWAARHEESLEGADLSIAFRIELTREQTDAFDEEALCAGRPPAPIAPVQRSALEVRQRRHERALRLRRLGVPVLVKPHKPKILGANFAVRLGAFVAVNGFDEEYRGYGQEDDDFTRRIYRAGFRANVAITSATVYHQWHETRAPGAWHQADGVARFNLPWNARCSRGLRHPIEQGVPIVEWFAAGTVRGTQALDAARAS